MFENPMRGRSARNFTTNALKILDLKSSSEQIFSKNWRWVPLKHYFSPCVKRQSLAWNGQQTEWNIVHKLSPFYLQKPAYGSMPLEPAETTARSNFPESRVAFSKVQAKLNTDETFLWLGQNILAKLQFNHAITYLSTPCANHTITHFRNTDKTIHNHA